MNLATHIIVGSAVAAPFAGNPIIGFFVGLVSHYVIDIIPHKGRKIHTAIEEDGGFFDKSSTEHRRNIIIDFSLALLDMSIGFILVGFVLFTTNLEVLLFFFVVGIGSIIPDALYILPKRQLLLKFHHYFHSWIQIYSKEPVKNHIPERVILEFLLIAISLFVLAQLM